MENAVPNVKDVMFLAEYFVIWSQLDDKLVVSNAF